MYSAVEIVISLLCFGLIALLAYVCYQLHLRLQRSNCMIDGLRNDISALCAGAAGMSRHLDKIEDHSRYLADRQDQITVSERSDRAYVHAMRMAAKGADVEELMSTCDLAREEAALICALHTGRVGGEERDL